MKKFVVFLLLRLILTDYAYAQVSFIPVDVYFPQIAIGGDASGTNYVTLIQVVNNNSTAVNGHLTLRSDTGTALSASFDGQPSQSSFDFNLESGATRQIRITLDGPITAGWMQITYSPSEAQTTVILQLRSGTAILSEVGVNPSFNTLTSTDFAAETDMNLNTGIALANPSSITEYVLLRLWDPGSGNLLGSTTLSMAPNGHVAKLLTELFPTVISITQIRAQLSLDSCASSACTSAGGTGFAATALRLNGTQFTTIPVIDSPAGGDLVRVLPQVAFGGNPGSSNMKTILYFTTTVPSGVFGTADIFDNDGNPLAASADGAAPSSSFTFTVAGNRVSRIVLSGDQTLRSGWIRLTLPGSVPLIVNAVFQTFNGSTVVSEASVLESPTITRGLIYVNLQAGTSNVGVAFSNAQPTANTITVQLFNQAGFLAASRNITLPPNGHLAQFVTEIFPEFASAADFNGSLSLRSGTGFSALALRLTSDKIATLPVALSSMFRPSITGLRITTTNRSTGDVGFSIDVTDFDSDIATSTTTTVSGRAAVDYGGNVGLLPNNITANGSSVINAVSGTLSGTFQYPVSGIPSGYPAVFYIFISDSAGNFSNVVSIPFKF